MTTLSDVTAQPAADALHIDGLLAQGPGWTFLAPARTTLLYSFSLAGGNVADSGTTYTGATSAFNPAQQAGVTAALARLTAITGVQFQPTSDGAAADLHFANANIVGASTAGFATTKWNYRADGNDDIVEYTADAWVYLDNVEFATSNGNPSVGTSGFEILLHELGHAMGLKHPFDGSVHLLQGDDNTANTLMSYTHSGGPYSDYSPYDVAALQYLYGDDGLGGALGWGRAGHLVVGSADADTLHGTDGNDRFKGAAGNDKASGGGGIDTAAYDGQRSRYTVTHTASGLTVQDKATLDGTDSLTSVERLSFTDQGLAFDLDGDAGMVARTLGLVLGGAAAHNLYFAGIGMALADRGDSDAAIMQLALNARLGDGFSNAALVDLLFVNLVGVQPSAAQQATWTGAIAAGTFTQLSLAQAAAALDLNAQNIDLAGLATDGLAYLPISS